MRFKSSNPDRNGFTLIETVLYTAFLAMGMVVLVTVFVAGLRTRSLIVAEQHLLESQRVAEILIRERLREATAVLTPASGTSTSLVVNSPVAGEDPVTFQVTNGVLTMTLGSGSAIPITGSGVRVTDFSITRLNGSPPSLTIEISYEADSASGATPSISSAFSYTLRYE